MSQVTAIVVSRLAERCNVRRVNVSDPRFQQGVAGKLAKALRSGAAMLRLATWSAESGAPLYMVANSGGGIWYNIAHAVVARRRGFHVYLHHHTFNYVNEYSHRMARLVRQLGPSSTHIMLCPEMRDAFERLYRPPGDLVIVPNTFVMQDREPESSVRPHHPFRIGHISNLTVVKGLDLVLDTLVALRERSVPVKLVLAGPTTDRRAADLVSKAQADLSEWFEYRGGVYGDAKWSFYSDIDALVFPTKYKREAYPLVIVEALSSGAPVISYGRACIPTLIGDTGGVAIDPDLDFVQTAVPILARWIERPAEYAAAAESARVRGAELRAGARRHFDELVERICGV